MLKIASFALRGFLLLFGAVVLGVSVNLAKQQAVGSVPTETSFSSFCGAFGLIVTAIGIAAMFFDKLPTFFVMGADVLSSIFYLAGGIALTVALKSVSSCTSEDPWAQDERYQNKLLTGGCWERDNMRDCPNAGNGEPLPGRCQQVQADYVFQYLGFVFGVAIIATTFFIQKRGGGRTAAYV